MFTSHPIHVTKAGVICSREPAADDRHWWERTVLYQCVHTLPVLCNTAVSGSAPAGRLPAIGAPAASKKRDVFFRECVHSNDSRVPIPVNSMLLCWMVWCSFIVVSGKVYFCVKQCLIQIYWLCPQNSCKSFEEYSKLKHLAQSYCKPFPSALDVNLMGVFDLDMFCLDNSLSTDFIGHSAVAEKLWFEI